MLWAEPQVWRLLCRQSSYRLWLGPSWAQWFQMLKGTLPLRLRGESLLMLYWLVHISIGRHALPLLRQRHHPVAWAWSLESRRSNFGSAVTCIPHFIVLPRFFLFLIFLTNWRFVATLKRASLWGLFSNTVCPLCVSVSQFVTLVVFQTVSVLLHLLQWSVISNLTIVKGSWLAQGSRWRLVFFLAIRQVWMLLF